MFFYIFLNTPTAFLGYTAFEVFPWFQVRNYDTNSSPIPQNMRGENTLRVDVSLAVRELSQKSRNNVDDSI